ncbi:MAG: phage replisome organizer N-terminal domain-containing protein [Clostridiaceae bacterium]|nr:phage replisome organizer N-terminal domain-containing protein [Clostridiaceae bacterium]
MFEDEKIDFIQSIPEGDSLLVIWVRLLTLAGKCNESGYIFLAETIPYTEEALSYKFKKSVNVVKLALLTFQNLNMIETNQKGIHLMNWRKHQSLDVLDKIREKEQARVRKQIQRE